MLAFYLICTLVPLKSVYSQKVQVFLDANHKGESKEISITSCASTLDPPFDKSISSINTNGHCVHLYKKQGCEGAFILMKPGTPVHGHFPSYSDFDLNDNVRSIGPCHQSTCHSDYIESTNASVKVKFYERVDYKGTQWVTIVKPKTCTLISQHLHRQVKSIKLDSKVCLEIYENWNCTGDSRQLPVFSPTLENLFYWGFIDRVKSFSFCGLNCESRSDTNVLIEQYEKPVGTDFVTIYSEKDFHGNFNHIQLTNQGCINMSVEWEGEILSINSSICIYIYDHKGCSRVGKSTQIIESVTDLKVKNFDEQIRSIESCKNISRTKTRTRLEKEEKDSNFSTVIISIVSGVIILLVVIVSIGTIFFLRIRKSQRYLVDILTERDIQEFLIGNEHFDGSSDTINYAYSLPYNTNYEIPRDLISFDSKNILGMGEYAVVYKGSFQHPTTGEKIIVALKTVKQNAGDEYVKALLKEIKTMSFVGDHTHVLKLVGCHTQNLRMELLVMTQLCENGSLEKFLKSYKTSFENCVVKGRISSGLKQENYTNTNDPTKCYYNTFHLIDWSCQIAEGMEYLASKKVIHGDLATRNVLLDLGFQIKIGDFGLSKQLYEYTQYVKKHQAPLPWRWLSIEVLTSMEFSSESDIWAYGITLWEIFSLGETPYPGSVWGPDFLSGLKDGLRPSKPKNATSDCYNLMLECWREEPKDRITFYELKEKLSDIIQTSSNLRYKFTCTSLL